MRDVERGERGRDRERRERESEAEGERGLLAAELLGKTQPHTPSGSTFKIQGLKVEV